MSETRMIDGGINTVILITSDDGSYVSNNLQADTVRVTVIGGPIHIRFASDSTVADTNDAIMAANTTEVFKINSTDTVSIVRATDTDAAVSITPVR